MRDTRPDAWWTGRRTRDWQRRLAQFGIRVAEATGDALPEEGVVALAREGRLVLCTTPEKLAVLTLNVQLVQRMALVLVDEIHILNDERGGVLEAALSRLLQAAATASAAVPGGGIRFVAASASIPNAEDIGEWLGCAAENVLVFGEECRPVPLSVHVETFPDSGNPFLFDRKLTPRVAGIVRAHSEGRPSLVFCATRKATVETARHLASAAGMKRELIRDHAHARRLQGVASSVSDTRLAELLRAGVGFHNADLGPADRAAVEDTFRAADLHVLCTTSTLAQGVNLPARLVVVKGTYGYRGAGVGFVPLPPSAVQQMIGRAGRPQYDAHGVAVIMSPGSIAHQYSASALARREPVESHLPRRLNEYVSAEVALGAIASVAEAESWLSRTFFRVRARRNPERYGLPSGPDTTQDRALAKVCGDCLAQLQGAGLIVRDGDAVAPTALGQITTRMVRCRTTLALPSRPDTGAVPAGHDGGAPRLPRHPLRPRQRGAGRCAQDAGVRGGAGGRCQAAPRREDGAQQGRQGQQPPLPAAGQGADGPRQGVHPPSAGPAPHTPGHRASPAAPGPLRRAPAGQAGGRRHAAGGDPPGTVQHAGPRGRVPRQSRQHAMLARAARR